jgi:phenylalanyl-tRNA synthetase beta chain
LLEKAGAEPVVQSRFSFAGGVDETRRVIDIPAGYISRLGGAQIPEETSKRILDSIGFETTIAPEGGLQVAVPVFRSKFDISIREDIAEEVLRLYGYDAVHPALPLAAIDSPPINPVVRNHHRARRMLAQSHAFVEMKTYSWYSAQWLQSIGYTPARRTLDLQNPIGADRGSLRESLVPNLLAVVEQNRAEASNFRIFEIGRVFWLDSQGEKQEATELCGMIVEQDRAANPETIFASARCAVEDMSRVAGCGSLRAQPGETASAPWRRTSATVNILQGQTPVGTMGLIPSALCAKLLGRGHIAWFTLDIDRFAGESYPATPYRPPPLFPGSTQDFTFVPPAGTNYAELEAILEKLNAQVSFNRSFVSTYRGEEGSARYTFRFYIFSPDRTLTAADISAFRTTLVRHVEENGIRLL